MTRSTTPDRRSRRRRIARRTVLGLALVGGTVATAGFVRRSDSAAPAPTSDSIFDEATVTSGTLATAETVDGTLQLSESLDVVHRIEGQSSTGGATSNTAASAPAALGFASTVGAIAASTDVTESVAAADCSAPTSTVIATTTTTMPPTPVTSEPVTSEPVTSEPVTSAPVTSQPPITEPSTTTPSSSPDAAPDVSIPSSAMDDAACAAVTDPVTDPATTLPVTGRSAPSGGGGGAVNTGTTAAAAPVTQTVTSITAAGTQVGLGDVLYTVESRPVVALSGRLPAWRTLSTDSDDGADIEQLERSLVSLGYDPDGSVVVDDEFDDATELMVERWQQGLGIEPTGEVELGAVAFLPTTTTVEADIASVGDRVGEGDRVLTLATPTQQVVFDVPTGMEAEITPGLAVGIESTTGTVNVLRSTERDGSVVVRATVSPVSEIEGAENGTTVSVTITIDDLDGVLIVPADALLSHLDGTYAVQIVDAAGDVTWATVDLLGVSGSKAAIAGDGVDEGTTVLVPAG